MTQRAAGGRGCGRGDAALGHPKIGGHSSAGFNIKKAFY